MKMIFICQACGCATFAETKEEARENLIRYTSKSNYISLSSCSHSTLKLPKPYLKPLPEETK